MAARKDHPQLKGAIDEAQWRGIGHIFAWAAAEVGGDTGTDVRIKHLASVPGWLTALTMAASTDGVVTCPRRLALRHAERLGLQVLDLPFPPDRIVVSVMRRAGASDAGVDWFLQQVRAAVGA